MFGMPFRLRRSCGAVRSGSPPVGGRPAPSFRSVYFTTAALAAALFGCASTTERADSPFALARSNPSSRAEAGARAASESALRAPVLGRETFVRAVLEGNPTLEAARHGFRAALARVRQAGTFDDPMLDVGIAPLSIAPSRTPLGFEVGVSQKLPWFGKRGLESEAAEAEAAAAKSDYEAVKRELALSALLLYDDYFVAARSLEINEEHVALMRALHESAIAAFASGRASAGDALMAEAELTHMEHDAVILATERDVTVAQMNELLHRPPELPLPPPPQDLPLPADPGARATTASAFAARPEIVAARQRARAEEVRAERAERNAYPDLTLSTSYNSMWDMPQHRWMVGVGLDLPLQTERRGGAADEARAMSAEYASDADRLTDAARTQAFVARRQLEEAAHVLELFERRLQPIAREEVDAARAGFATGRSPFTSVLEAERNLRRVELEYQMKRAEYARRRAELDRALGRIPGLDWKDARP
jgi:cobalt-zinc-cadmium efflux system outer membrane protein